MPEWKLAPGLTVTGKSALRVQNYYIACGLVLLVLVFLRNLVHSRVGRALQAIHDRETAANAMGINTAAYKLKVFVLSALLAAMAGVFFTHYTGGIGPSEAGALKSVRYVALAAAGGMANLWGVTVVSVALNYLLAARLVRVLRQRGLRSDSDPDHLPGAGRAAQGLEGVGREA